MKYSIVTAFAIYTFYWRRIMFAILLLPQQNHSLRNWFQTNSFVVNWVGVASLFLSLPSSRSRSLVEKTKNKNEQIVRSYVTSFISGKSVVVSLYLSVFSRFPALELCSKMFVHSLSVNWNDEEVKADWIKLKEEVVLKWDAETKLISLLGICMAI